MERIVEHGLLYDFYGELLTAHQKQIYEDAVYHDMSLAEIADIQGISRQGVHDLLRRCDKILEQYEERLGLVKRFGSIKEKVNRIDALAKAMSQRQSDVLSEETERTKQAAQDGRCCVDSEALLAISRLAAEILEEL